eukprot:scaffold3060_cov121-Isochrysis_galbana.AAC.1
MAGAHPSAGPATSALRWPRRFWTGRHPTSTCRPTPTTGCCTSPSSRCGDSGGGEGGSHEGGVRVATVQ